jgi:hypothetical protein
MNKLSEITEKKFIESIDVDDWEIETDTGWSDIRTIHKTIEYDVYNLETESGKILECADNHILFDSNFQEIYAKDSLNLKIKTKDGDEQVTSLVKTNSKENMFDLELNDKNHRFYTNGILSHNTTTIGSYLLWVAIFNKEQNIAILANKGETAKEIIIRIQKSYENLPLWLQQGVKEWNKHSIVLENGSRLLATSTGSSAGRGQSFNIVMLDEFAFVPRNIAEDFITSIYPVISSGTKTKIIMVSTPNGMNLFYKYWQDAVNKKSSYVPYEAHWNQVPGRDENWKKETIANTSEEQFEQEFECRFKGGSNTLISPQKLAEMVWSDPIRKFKTSDGNMVNSYVAPSPERSYVMIVDTSHGQGMDYSAFSIIDVTETPYRVCATFRSNNTSPLLYPDIIVSTAKLYNNAHLLIESNDIGQQIINSIRNDLEYEYIFSTTTQGRGGQRLSSGFGGKSSKLGIKTTDSLKRIGCANLKTLIESDTLIVEDYQTIEEMSTFVRNSKMSYSADPGTNDDMIMTLVLFAWLSKEKVFKEITNIDIRKKLYSENIRKIEEEILPPAPLISDGREEESFVCNNGDRWVIIDEYDW